MLGTRMLRIRRIWRNLRGYDALAFAFQLASYLPSHYGEGEAYVRERGMSFSRMDIGQLYMVFGGVPYYWSLLEKGKSVEQNVDSLVFAERGKLRNEFNDVFFSLFRNGESYRSVVRALSTVKEGVTRDELLRKTGLPDCGKFTDWLADRTCRSRGQHLRDEVRQGTVCHQQGLRPCLADETGDVHAADPQSLCAASDDDYGQWS